jgi:NTP pyrophosphatase (non-canonical NTP hydrolase)
MSKSLAGMTEEIVSWCKEKGWYDKPSVFGEHMALLHSEVSEAVEAWRIRGLDSWDVLRETPGADDGTAAKPEGVGSELADVFIRLLDDLGRYGVTLPTRDFRWILSGGTSLANMTATVSMDWSNPETSFLEDMNALHQAIARAVEVPELGCMLDLVLIRLLAACGKYGIDLEAEYERKMAYNRTRAKYHGAKAI